MEVEGDRAQARTQVMTYAALARGETAALELRTFAPDKQEEARQLGAHHFVVTNHAAQMGRVTKSLDLLVTTATVNLDWAAWLNTLRPNGTSYLLGAVPGPIISPVLPMIFGQFPFAGSVIGAPRQIEEMMRFAALHNVRAMVEVAPMNDVNQALDKVRKNQVRYRKVLAL